MSFDNTVANPVNINGLNCITYSYESSNTAIKISCVPTSSVVTVRINGVKNPNKLI